jgi:hypothetical protein
MLGLVAPFFEHKLFVTATPHNGHTRSFTGLLERLDPVRFTRKGELTDLDKRRITEVNVRRLKREINTVTNPPRFCERDLQAIEIRFDAREETVSEAFQDFRLAVKRAVAGEGKQRQRAGAFAVEILGKRLLSCPWTFAESWHRYKLAFESDTAVTDASVRAAEAAVREDTGDDLEFESRYQHAVHTVGAWLRPFVDRLKAEIATIDNALAGIELDRFTPDVEPAIDARLDGLIKWIDEKLRNGNAWRNDERLIVFTEYKTTLDYLYRRLLAEYEDSDAILTLFGNMGDKLRTAIKEAFNDPTARVRILIATDAASEGLNLQETARYLLHWDIPWNPARLEQRNGRLDRHGQARDVVVHHFATEDDHDLAFLAHVIGKLENIREDIGATGELFERAFERRFIEGEDAKALENELDLTTERVRQRVELPRDQQALPKKEDAIGSRSRLDRLAAELDLHPVSMRQTLEVAMSLGFRFPVFVDTESPTRVRFGTEVPPSWQGVVDDSVRHPRTRALPALTFDSSYFIETLAWQGVVDDSVRHPRTRALPALTFDSSYFIETLAGGGRPVFRPKPDTLLLHLAHPLFHQTFSTFARIRFQDTAHSRWIVRRGGLPAGAQAVLLLTVEELAVNDLRETFHHWVRTLALPVKDGALWALLPHRTAQEWREIVAGEIDANSARHAVSIWDGVEEDVKDFLGEWRSTLSQRLKCALEGQRDAAITAENERYNSRQGEVSKLIAENTVQRIERELAELAVELQQGMLFAEDQRELLRTKEALESELAHRTAHFQELRELLSGERERITKQLLPRRYAMSGEPQVFPIALEIRLP